MPGERKARMSNDEIEAVVLELPEDDREELLTRLSARGTRNPAVRQAWLDEAERRMELVRTGKMRLIDADEALADELESPTARERASAALKLSADARAEVADRLIASLTGNRGYDPAWEAEMNRRIDEIEAGTAKTLSEEEFFEKVENPPCCAPGIVTRWRRRSTRPLISMKQIPRPWPLRSRVPPDTSRDQGTP